MGDPTATYDVCIVGAGIAGLNAAYVASGYLPRTARMLVVDRHDRPGGMWNEAYSYVRLHQPHLMFTAGDIAWTLGQRPSYLATRDEVMGHLQHCFEVVSDRVDVEALWGWEYVDDVETADGLAVTLRGPGGTESTIHAERLINAVGFNIEVNEPLALSSSQVRSISPHQLAPENLLGRDDTAPVWVIGSGKTGMDTVNAIVAANPDREVGLVTGSGTFFIRREAVYVEGWRRWLAGIRPNLLFTELARKYDGTNADEAIEWFRTNAGVSPLGTAPHHIFGALSSEEAERVRAGVSETVRDRLEDVVDEDGVPVMVLQSGERKPIQPGSWVVNCTGHFPARDDEAEPYLSVGGRRLSINSTSVTLGFSTVSAYYLTHLLYLDLLSEIPLYALDLNDLLRTNRDAFAPLVSTLILYNLGLILDRAPRSVFQQCGLDFDRWYPWPRRFAGQLKLVASHKRDRPRQRQALDAFRERTGVRCGPLEAVAAR